jgi:putative DNA primase/helicase
VLDFARFAPNRSRKSSLWPNIELFTLSRMADLDRWGEAVMRGLGEPPGTFIAAYRANRRAACADVLEQSPVAAALVTMLARQYAFEGSPAELLQVLNSCGPRRASVAAGWPTSPWDLSKIHRRLATQLRETGVAVSFARKHTGRLIRIFRICTSDTES